jgi:Na+/H+ antiporter NhaC
MIYWEFMIKQFSGTSGRHIVLPTEVCVPISKKNAVQKHILFNVFCTAFGAFGDLFTPLYLK